jgi:YVTN family beta-propeller protein
MMRWASLLVFLVSACTPATSVPADSKPAAATGKGVLLVGNKGENTLGFIDLGTGEELGRLETGPQPHEVAVSPDGRLAAAVAYGGNTIDIFDTRSRARTRSIDLGAHGGPHGIIWLADGRLIVATGRSQSVVAVDARSGLVRPIATGQRSTHMVVVSPDGSTAYASNIGSGTVSVIDLKSFRKVRDIETGGQPEGITLTDRGRVLWVGDNESARVQAYDTQSFKRLVELPTGQRPLRVLASPDERWVLTSNSGDGTITVIDAVRREISRTIDVSRTSEAAQITLLFAPDGRRLYAAEPGRDQVVEIAWPSGETLRRLRAGRAGDGLAIVP